VLDWADLPPVFAERYLGRLEDSPDVYAHHSLRGEPVPDSLLVAGAGLTLRQEFDFIRAELS
jgi:dipeptidyl-peptidase-4